MRTMPDNFTVEELIDFPEEPGSFSYYRVEKNHTSVEKVRAALATNFKITPSAVVFPALRDYKHKAVQYASVRQSGPNLIEGDRYTAQYIRHGSRALRSTDLQGNRFKIQLRNIPIAKANAFTQKLYQLEETGLPNYFGAQRFITKTQFGFVGKAILDHEPLQVLRLYLSETNPNDALHVTEFKSLVKSHWGQWGYLLHKAPRPSNFRSVITYLKDHPNDHEKAVNLIRDQYLSTFLDTYQAWIWNLVLAHYLEHNAETSNLIQIAGVNFPLVQLKNCSNDISSLNIELPRLTAHYPGVLGQSVHAVLANEGLSFEDFDVRLIRRVCLVKSERAVWFAPSHMKVQQSNDSADSDNQSLMISFDLKIRQYATLVVNTAFAYLEMDNYKY